MTPETIHQLQQEINSLTQAIRQKDETVYKHLSESPIGLPNEEDVSFRRALQEYRDKLKSLLQHINSPPQQSTK